MQSLRQRAYLVRIDSRSCQRCQTPTAICDRRRVGVGMQTAARDDVTPEGYLAMKSPSTTASPATADTGRIRFGGGWRLPSSKPTN